MSEKEQPTKSPTVVRTNEGVEAGISLTEKQRASGQRIYFTPPQEGVEFGTSVKANSLEKAQEMTGVQPAPDTTDTPPAPDEPVNTDEGSTK